MGNLPLLPLWYVYRRSSARIGADRGEPANAVAGYVAGVADGFHGVVLLTPIIYPLSYVPSRFTTVWHWNPFTPIVSSYRAILLEGTLPALADLGTPCVWTAVVLLSGHWVFSRLEPEFADLL